MKTFIESLGLPAPDKNLSPVLKSLWYDAKGDWNQAHAQVDHLRDLDSAWVHAYLHRKEGDLVLSNPLKKAIPTGQGGPK